MQLKFEGNTHSIDANTLISVLGHYQSIAKVANEIYGGGSRDIRVNVNAVEGFSVIDKDSATTFNRGEFKDYIYDDFDSEEDIPNERKVEKEAVLTIVGLKFERNSRWQFLYEGFKIAITVKDDALMKKIDEGERFGKGDAIKVRMLIVQSYNKEYKAYENKSYKIVEFIDHIISTRPPVLFEGQE